MFSFLLMSEKEIMQLAGRDFQINFNDVVLPQFIRLFSCFLCIWRQTAQPTLSRKSYSIIIIQIHSPTWAAATWPRVQIQIVSRGSDELWWGEIFVWKYRWKKCNHVVRVRLQAGHLQWPKTEAGPRLHPSHTLTWSQMGTIIHSRPDYKFIFLIFFNHKFPMRWHSWIFSPYHFDP